jgi:hypothetical protein
MQKSLSRTFVLFEVIRIPAQGPVMASTARVADQYRLALTLSQHGKAKTKSAKTLLIIAWR